ncbi:FtsX-like permease family protein [Brachybacterium hainanense]|uniref:FtsX-like permease family protein n=1 Tax=Brachybacterium hainanense TaxID=1541174 RepID=A0ABV6RBY7_9MICO
MSRPQSRRRARPQLTPLRRHVAAIITIALSTAFVAVLVLAGNLMTASIDQSSEAPFRGADLVIDMSGTDPVENPDGTLSAPPRPEIEGVETMWATGSSYVQMRPATGGGASRFVELRPLPPQEAAPTALREGRAASAPDEITLSPGAAEDFQVSVGEDLLARTVDDQGEEHETTLRVTGIVESSDTGSALFSFDSPWAVLTEANAPVLTGAPLGAYTSVWLASVEPGADPSAIIASSSSDAMQIQTAERAIADAKSQGLSGIVAMGSIFGVFVVIALVTAAVVVGNTFTVTLAQRTRDLALLRTLGATRRQVAATVRGESLRVGLLGSAAGMLLGHVLAQLALLAAFALGWTPGLGIVPASLLSVLLPLGAGVLVTGIAGIAPLRRATGVAPLEALRPVEASSRGAGRLRAAGSVVVFLVGLGLLLAGTGISLGGAQGIGLLMAILGGVLSFAAALIGLVVITPVATSLVGRLVRRIGGVPATVAAANTLRHPRRSAATISALLIGTTLMTMMAVGAHTAEVSLTADLDNRKPVDVIVRADAMPEDALAQVESVQGVADAVIVPTAELDVDSADTMTLYGPAAEQIDGIAVRDDISAKMADGVLLTGGDRAQKFGLHDGQEITVPAAGGGTVRLTVRLDGNLSMSLLTPATFAEVAGPSSATSMFVRLASPDDPARGGLDSITVLMNLQDWLEESGFENVRATGDGIEREMYGQILGVLLAITLGMLAVAVLVALVGVANTLSLGVVERTGENALLRALGTTRTQMRAMLAWEGLLLALIGAALGVALGMLYGTTGIMAIFGATFPTVVTVPWVQVLTVIGLTLLAGLLASVLPARRAASTAPAQALAAEG